VSCAVKELVKVENGGDGQSGRVRPPKLLAAGSCGSRRISFAWQCGCAAAWMRQCQNSNSDRAMHFAAMLLANPLVVVGYQHQFYLNYALAQNHAINPVTDFLSILMLLYVFKIRVITVTTPC
jgi:hypothetical protein